MSRLPMSCASSLVCCTMGSIRAKRTKVALVSDRAGAFPSEMAASATKVAGAFAESTCCSCKVASESTSWASQKPTDRS